MLWFLIALLLLVCLVALAFTLLTLWRRVKDLGRQVVVVGETVDAATAALDPLHRAAPDCPTCGAPASAATKPVGVRAEPASPAARA